MPKTMPDFVDDPSFNTPEQREALRRLRPSRETMWAAVDADKEQRDAGAKILPRWTVVERSDWEYRWEHWELRYEEEGVATFITEEHARRIAAFLNDCDFEL